MKIGWLLFGVAVSGLMQSPVLAADNDYVENEVLVKWNDLPANVDSVSKVRVSDVPTALALFARDERVEYVEPNYQRYLAVVPADNLYPDQWYLEQTNDHDIDAEQAWAVTTGSQDIIVAVIDTGIDLNHPDLVDNLWTNPGEVPDNGVDDDLNGYIDDVHGWDFVMNDNNPSAQPDVPQYSANYVTHGTHVAGIIGASGNNSIGVSGLNWSVSLMSLKVFDSEGKGDVDRIAAAVAYALANGAVIINMSYGGGLPSQTEEAAMANAFSAGALLVAAVGNSNTNTKGVPFFPACYDHILGVAATDDLDQKADFSSYGTACTDLAAPGSDILSTYYQDETGAYSEFDTKYDYLSGTSMAAPVVSGIAALLKANDPTLSATNMAQAILERVDYSADDRLGAGRVNAGQTLAVAAVAIETYTSDQRVVSLASTERANDGTPYFQWDETYTPNAIVGYYVYFGRERLDPVTAGVLQTERYYAPTESLHGNERTYRLRVKALDGRGQVSSLSQSLYVVDRAVQRPIWRSLQVVPGAVELRWNKIKGEHVDYYQVYRSRQRDQDFEYISGRVFTRRYTDDHVQSGKRYYYKVRAVDDLGNVSNLSAVQTAKL